MPSGGGSVTVTVPSFSPTTAHRTYVTIGGWPVASTWSYSPPAPSTGCWVMSASGANTGKPCSIDLTRSRALDFGDGRPQGQRTANVYLRFVVAGLAAGEHIRFTVDMRSVPGLPSGWSTWNTPNRGFALGNLEAEPGARCADLPLLTARAPAWASGGGEIHFTYFEDRPAHATGCT